MATPTAVAAQQREASRRGTRATWLWDRKLTRYPSSARRYACLAIVVLSAILLYYQLYVGGAVAPQILAHYQMSFRFYVDISVVSSAIGACTSVLAGMADRWGRANMVVYGLLVTALLVLFGVPNAPNGWTFAVLICAVGFVEGIVLVATPALVRDFSPQLGRASAMGFWTLGPVVGSLAVAEVASHTLGHLHAWQDQFVICGIVGIAVFLLALIGLRELSPPLRDQLMVSLRDRKLIEMRAAGIDVEASLRRPWRQVLKADVVLAALAISLFLVIYYTAVGFNTVYFETVFGYSAAKANSIGNWWWAVDAVALVVVGVLSDRLRVRKPFMVIGAVGAVVFTIVYLSKATEPHTSFDQFVVIVSLLSGFMAVAYAPWMAAFTETVERRNPALAAHGLAVWGWTIRAVVALSAFLLPFVVSSTNPLVQYGALGQKALAIERADPTIKIVLAHPHLFAELSKYPTSKIPAPLLAEAVKEVGLKKLLAVAKDPHARAESAFFSAHAAQLREVVDAKASTPAQWQHWYWVCVAGELCFLPLVLLMAGRWSPRGARKDAIEHDWQVESELADLADRRAGTPAPG